MCAFFGEQSQIVQSNSFNQCEFLFFVLFYILKTMCNNVRERVKNALSCTLLQWWVFKIFEKEKLHIDQKYLGNYYEICHQQMHTYLKNKYFLTAWISNNSIEAALLSMLVRKNPISEVKKKINSTKFKFSSNNNLLSDLVIKSST